MIMILRESFRERDKSLVSVIERIMIIHPAKTKEWGLIKRIPLQGLACLFQTKLGEIGSMRFSTGGLLGA